jgi:hypothetical protein
MPTKKDWPDGMTDKEAAERLRSLVLAVSDGNRGLSNENAYKRLRRVAIGRPDLADVLPSFVRSQRDFALLSGHLKAMGTDRQLRRDEIAEAFGPLIDRVEGRTRPPVRSSRWTGKRTVKQQAQIVLSLAPTAFQAVDMLLDEQERPLHNGGPVEPERLDAIAQLRDLHGALGELIALAQAGRPFESQLQTVRALKDRAFQWSKETYELMLAQSPLMASSAVYGTAIWYLTNLITKDVSASATMSAGVLGATALVTGRKGSAARQPDADQSR